MSFTLISYVWKAALRDRVLLAILVLLAISTSLSTFLASGAITEKDQFAAVLSAGGIRIIGILGLVVFTIFFIRRSLESKDIELLLSRPINRIGFILSYAAAFSGLAIIIALACAASLFITAPHMIGGGHVVWAISLMLEYVIVVNVAFFFAMMLSSAAISFMSVIGFYILSRMMGQLLGILDASATAGVWSGLEIIMQIISVVTPRLDLLGQTTWLIYGVENIGDILFVGVQCLVFLVLILTASLIDLLKRQF